MYEDEKGGGFLKRTKIDENIKRVYISSLENCSKEVYYLTLIGTKILSSQGRSIGIDYERLYDELVYFKYYSEMSDENLLDFFMPLILVSRGYSNYEKDAIELADKLTTFYKRKEKFNEYVLDVFCYDIVLRNAINDRRDFNEVVEEIKAALLGFNPFSEDKLKNVKFQMVKIKYIEEAHRLEDRDEESINIPFFKRLLRDFDKKLEVGNNPFEEAMAEYLLKLRYFEIQSPRYMKGASPRNFLKLEVGETMKDPIMNKVELISKEKTDEAYEIEIMTKTGKYNFEFKLK